MTPLPHERTKIFLNEALNIWQEKEMQKRKEKARHLLESAFDFETFAARTLVDHWSFLNQEQKREFLNLFKAGFYEKALSRLEQPLPQKIALKITGESLKDNDRHVQCRFVKNGKRGNFTFVWIYKEDRWRWVDLEASGASLVVNYQGQFNKIIRDHGFSELLRRLKSKRI